MKNLPLISRVFGSLSLISLAIWIGAYTSRLFYVYNLFEGPELELKYFVNSQNIAGIISSLPPIIITHLIAFCTLILFTTLFLLFSKISLKKNGWLFVILISMVITIPFEFYLMLIDYKIVNFILSNTFKNDVIIELLRKRIKILSGFPIIILLTYISYFYFIIFQPLTKNTDN